MSTEECVALLMRVLQRSPDLAAVLLLITVPQLLVAQEPRAPQVAEGRGTPSEAVLWHALPDPLQAGERLEPGSGSPRVQTPTRTFGRAWAGLGAGVTVSAILTTAALATGDGNACTGSGDYLGLCRAWYVGSTAAGGALGAVIGAVMRRDAPAGPATPALLGSAVGALSAFVLSIPACEQEDATNPAVLCGRHGMTSPGITLSAAGVGGLVGYLIGRREPAGLEISGIGPVPTPNGATAIGVSFARSTR